MKAKTKKRSRLDGPYGDLLDQVSSIGRQLYDKQSDHGSLFRRIERLMNMRPLPKTSDLEKVKAEFFALPSHEQSVIFNGWQTMTRDLPRHDIPTDLHRNLVIDPSPNLLSAHTCVEWRPRPSITPVEIYILEGTDYCEALACIDIARDLILRQFGRLTATEKVELRHV